MNKYVENNGGFCPVCSKEEELYFVDKEFTKNNYKVKIISCLSCNSVWDEYWLGDKINKIDIRLKNKKKRK